MKITYMAFLGILIALMVSCAENSTPTISEVDNSDISKTTQSEQPVYSSIKSVTYGPQKVVSTSVLPQRRPNE